MKQITVTIPTDDNGNGTREVEISALMIEKSFFVDQHESKLPIPAMVTSDGKLRLLVNTNIGYVDYDAFKRVKQANIGTMPLAILSLEKYYVAHEAGLLTQLWD